MPQRDIEATITFLPTEHGGKKIPSYKGYRPQFYCDGLDYDAALEYPDVEAAEPGDTVRTYLGFTHPELLVSKLHVGKPFLVREGHHIVAYGSITAMLKLKESAATQIEKRKNL